MTKRYLVTGASGFIGRSLCQFLQKQGYKVRALVRKPLEGPWDESVIADIADSKYPQNLFKGIDGVFHLAGIAHFLSEGQESEYFKINAEGTKSLLDVAISAGVTRFINFSTIKAAGDPGDACVDESWNVLPDDAYGESKFKAEQYVLEAGNQHGIHVCNLRSTLVYGPGIKGNLKRMLHAIEHNQFPPIQECENRRSMVSLDDLISAAWLAMTNPVANGKTYIVSDENHYSTRKIYEAMSMALNRNIPRWSVPNWCLRTGALVGDTLQRFTKIKIPLDSTVYTRLTGSAHYSSKKIRQELGWKPTQSFFREIDTIVNNVGQPKVYTPIRIETAKVTPQLETVLPLAETSSDRIVLRAKESRL